MNRYIVLSVISIFLALGSCGKREEESFQISVSTDTVDLVGVDYFSCAARLKGSDTKDVTKYYARIPALNVIWRDSSRTLRIEGMTIDIAQNDYTESYSTTLDVDEIAAWRGSAVGDVIVPSPSWPINAISFPATEPLVHYEFIHGFTSGSITDCAPIFGGVSITQGKEKTDFSVNATLTMIGVSRDKGTNSADDRSEYATTTINLHNRGR